MGAEAVGHLTGDTGQSLVDTGQEDRRVGDVEGARIETAGAVVPGVPRVADGPPVNSTASLAVAETWARL